MAAASYSFASPAYVGCFGGVPDADVTALRQAAINYMEKFDTQEWYQRPVCTILNGVRREEGKRFRTVDWAQKENGEYIASGDDMLHEFIKFYQVFKPKRDYREAIRKIDHELMNLPLAGVIIGNQSLDFGKQDGITEIEEAGQANLVEQRINDGLLADEDAGKVEIGRSPAFVGCVSNFSNFLDLSRKVMRNIELGVPAVVLHRSNTTQHTFRWTELLVDLFKKHGIDQGMISYACFDREQKNVLFQTFPFSPSYFTCSREVAEAIVKVLPKTMSSTGGPNTMVTTKMTPEVGEAFLMSNMIENKGQCTALRHFVAPECSETQLEKLYAKVPVIERSLDSIKSKSFASLFKDQAPVDLPASYSRFKSQPLMSYRIDQKLPEEIDEAWRVPVVDVTTPGSAEIYTPEFKLKLAQWLNKEQPIALAMNGDPLFAREIFETTGLVVYTVGSLDKPALTCQARPQDGEIFGEFPPRHELHKFTHLPVVIPSSTPGYNTVYTDHYLKQMSIAALPTSMRWVEPIAAKAQSGEVHGFLKLLVIYLFDSCGPKQGFGKRTSLFGLQRPPLIADAPTVFRIARSTTGDDLLPSVIPFIVTNARTQLQLSVDPGVSSSVRGVLGSFTHLLDKSQVVEEDQVAFEKRSASMSKYNLLVLGERPFEPILDFHWISRFFPMGHIKSVNQEDPDFIGTFMVSKKWLRVHRSHLSAL
jgi:hypothetical protein